MIDANILHDFVHDTAFRDRVLALQRWEATVLRELADAESGALRGATDHGISNGAPMLRVTGTSSGNGYPTVTVRLATLKAEVAITGMKSTAPSVRLVAVYGMHHTDASLGLDALDCFDGLSAWRAHNPLFWHALARAHDAGTL